MGVTRVSSGLDHYYVYGDVYEALDACDQLDLLAARLGRQHVLADEECARIRRGVATIRNQLERHVERPPQLPKGPRLP